MKTISRQQTTAIEKNLMKEVIGFYEVLRNDPELHVVAFGVVVQGLAFHKRVSLTEASRLLHYMIRSRLGGN